MNCAIRTRTTIVMKPTRREGAGSRMQLRCYRCWPSSPPDRRPTTGGNSGGTLISAISIGNVSVDRTESVRLGDVRDKLTTPRRNTSLGTDMKTTIDPGKSDIEYDASSTKPPRV